MGLAIKLRIRPEWAALAVGVLAAAGIYAAFIRPSLASASAMTEARAQRDSATNDLLETRRQHQVLLSAITDQKRQLETLGGSPPSVDDRQAQLARIASIAHDCRLVIDEYLPIGDVDAREYSASYVQFTARGPFLRVCDFFRRVESEMDYVDVTHFTMTSSVDRAKPTEPACLVSWSCKLSGMPRRRPELEKAGAPAGTPAAEVALHGN
jgi:hypothetical protein